MCCIICIVDIITVSTVHNVSYFWMKKPHSYFATVRQHNEIFINHNIIWLKILAAITLVSDVSIFLFFSVHIVCILSAAPLQKQTKMFTFRTCVEFKCKKLITLKIHILFNNVDGLQCGKSDALLCALILYVLYSTLKDIFYSIWSRLSLKNDRPCLTCTVHDSTSDRQVCFSHRHTSHNTNM